MKINQKYFSIFHLLLFIFLLLNGCQSSQKPNFRSIIQSQPYLVGLTPNPNDYLEKIERIELIFSSPIDPDSLNEKSILILQDEIDPNQPPTLDLIDKNLSSGKFAQILGTTTLEKDSNKVIWTPSAPLQNENYSLIITSKLEGVGKIPFNQNPGEKTSPFIALFKLLKNSEQPPPKENDPPPTPPKERPTTLVLNEILYDALESDTDGNEFIELYGTPNTEIDGYQIILINGADGKVLKIITLPENSNIQENGIFLIADAETGKPSQSHILESNFIDNFDPQNGPDAVQLLDDQGRLIDSLTYGSGALSIASNGFLMGEGDPAVNVSEGHSLSRIGGIDTNINQIDFLDLEMPTPGVL